MQIKAKDVGEKDRIQLPARGARQVTRIIPRYLRVSTWYELQFGPHLSVICQGEAELTLADPEFIIDQDRLVQVDYPESPRFARKSYEPPALGDTFDGLPGWLRW